MGKGAGARHRLTLTEGAVPLPSTLAGATWVLKHMHQENSPCSLCRQEDWIRVRSQARPWGLYLPMKTSPYLASSLPPPPARCCGPCKPLSWTPTHLLSSASFCCVLLAPDYLLIPVGSVRLRLQWVRDLSPREQSREMIGGGLRLEKDLCWVYQVPGT